MQCNKKAFSKDYQPFKSQQNEFLSIYIPNADKQDTFSAVSFAGLPIFRQKDQVLLWHCQQVHTL